MSYQVMPPLSDSEVDDLRESIRERGVLSAVLVTSDGTIVDGHHRKAIADRLGVDCPTQVVYGTPTELRSLAYETNLARRHLTREQHRAITEQSLRDDPELSNREHARRTGVDHKTVAAIREPLESTGEIPQLDARRSADGRERPAHAAPKPEPIAQAVASYPELAHYRDTDQAKKAVELAHALDGYDEPERKMRRDNLAKAIAAEQRNGGPFRPSEPDPGYTAAIALFDAATKALIQIRRIDGPAVVAEAAGHVEAFEAENWRGQFQQAADTYKQLADACRQKLRAVR